MAKKSTKKVVESDSVFDLLPKSWELVKKNWQVFAIVNAFGIIGAIFSALGIKDTNNQYGNVASSVGEFPGGNLLLLGGIFYFSLLVAAIMIFFAVMNVCLSLKSAKNKKPKIDELIEDGKKYYFRMFGLAILSGLIIAGGLILFIIPGVIAISRLIMAPFILIEKNTTIIEAMKKSNEFAVGKFGLIWAALLLVIAVGIVQSILNSIPVLGPLAGIVIVIGFSLILPLRYLQIKNEEI